MPAAPASLQGALAAHRAGDLPQAEWTYRTLLAIDPDDAAALQHYATLCLQCGRAAEALALAERAAQVAPDLADAHTGLATALSVLGRHEAAVESYEAALGIAPDHPEANYGLGATLHAQQRHDEAIACFQRALSADPEYPEAEFALGVTLQATRQYNDAIRHYGNALALDPDDGAARHALGTVLQAQGRHAAAIEAYRDVLTRQPDRIETRLQISTALQALGRHAEALGHVEHARELRNTDEILLRHGNLLQEIGRIAQARQCYAQAIACAPRNPGGYLAWFGVARVAPDDPFLAAAEALARDMADWPDRDRMTLHFALAKACGDLGRHAESFRHSLDANALQRHGLRYDETAVLAALDRIRQVVTPDLLGARRGAGDPSALPIFIVGMPRCGSSLLEQILASHPAVFGGGERMDFGDTVEAVCGGPAAPAYPDLVASLTPTQVTLLGTRYVARLQAAIPPGRAATVRHVTDKRLDNFALVGLIHLAFPNARIIHMCRNPIDTCLSCFTTNFAEVPFASDLGELGRYHRAYRAVMAHWRTVLPADAMLEVRYETLVDDLEGQARRVLAYCGLDWDAACLAFHRTERPVRTASMAQVRQPLYRGSLARWRPPPDLLQPLLAALGPDGS